MIYYRVKPEFDNCNKDKNFGIFIGNELYTEKELIKVKRRYYNYYKTVLNFDRIFERVEISKRRIYWFFGARFEIKE